MIRFVFNSIQYTEICIKKIRIVITFSNKAFSRHKKKTLFNLSFIYYLWHVSVWLIANYWIIIFINFVPTYIIFWLTSKVDFQISLTYLYIEILRQLPRFVSHCNKTITSISLTLSLHWNKATSVSLAFSLNLISNYKVLSEIVLK